MKKIARFDKVSREQFLKDWRDVFGEEESEEKILSAYSSILLPRRATAGSAGYDFFLPCPICLKPGSPSASLRESGLNFVKDGCFCSILEVVLALNTGCR